MPHGEVLSSKMGNAHIFIWTLGRTTLFHLRFKNKISITSFPIFWVKIWPCARIRAGISAIKHWSIFYYILLYTRQSFHCTSIVLNSYLTLKNMHSTIFLILYLTYILFFPSSSKNEEWCKSLLWFCDTQIINLLLTSYLFSFS